jgi:hypothetical protein
LEVPDAPAGEQVMQEQKSGLDELEALIDEPEERMSIISLLIMVIVIVTTAAIVYDTWIHMAPN